MHPYAQTLTPFIGAKLEGRPKTQAVDITRNHAGTFVDADVRAVTPDGVSVFFYSRCDFIRFDEITELRVVAIENGERVASRRIEARRAA